MGTIGQPGTPPDAYQTPRAPLPGLTGRAAAWVYRRIIAARNRRFDAGRGVIELDRPVISIGNLSAGGTGKTPTVQHFASLLLRSGHRPCIAMRGYGSPRGRGELSDEALLYREAFPDVPIVAQPNRVEGLLDLFASKAGDKVDVILLDDGFQHRRLARVLDIVLVDALRSPWDDHLIPAGLLREGPASLARAHAIIITHAQSIAEAALKNILRNIAAVNPRAVIARSRHAWRGFDVMDSGGVQAFVPPTAYARQRIFAVCAVGNPGPFLAAAASHGDLVGHLALPDHDPFAIATVGRIIDAARRADARAIVVTPKDWTKLAKIAPNRWPCPVARPRLVIEFIEGQMLVEKLVLEAAATKMHDQ